MKKLKAICATTVLVLTLSIAAYGDDTTPGDSHSPGNPVPIQTGGVTTPPDSSQPASGTAPLEGNNSGSLLSDILWALVTIF